MSKCAQLGSRLIQERKSGRKSGYGGNRGQRIGKSGGNQGEIRVNAWRRQIKGGNQGRKPAKSGSTHGGGKSRAEIGENQRGNQGQRMAEENSEIGVNEWRRKIKVKNANTKGIKNMKKTNQLPHIIRALCCAPGAVQPVLKAFQKHWFTPFPSLAQWLRSVFCSVSSHASVACGRLA